MRADMTETRTVHRTFHADRLTLGDLRKVALDAHGEGLDDRARVGFRSWYKQGHGNGWMIELTIFGEVTLPARLHIEEEHRDRE